MADDFGAQYSATGEGNPLKKRRRAGDPAQVLSLQLPRTVGPTSPIPQQLLRGPGAQGAADPGIALLAQILTAIGQPPPGSVPTPGIAPPGVAPPGSTGGGWGGAAPSFQGSAASPTTPPPAPPRPVAPPDTTPRITPGEDPESPRTLLPPAPGPVEPQIPDSPFPSAQFDANPVARRLFRGPVFPT